MATRNTAIQVPGPEDVNKFASAAWTGHGVTNPIPVANI